MLARWISERACEESGSKRVKNEHIVARKLLSIFSLWVSQASSSVGLQKPEEEEEEPGQLATATTLDYTATLRLFKAPVASFVQGVSAHAHGSVHVGSSEKTAIAHFQLFSGKTWPPRPPIPCICSSGTSTMPAFFGSWRTCAGSRV